MTDGHHVLFLVEVAAGIVIGFMIWSMVSPMLFPAPVAPTA